LACTRSIAWTVQRKMGQGMKTVIFDLDGTLADTSGDLIDATNACFEAMGVGPQLAYGQDAALSLHGARAMLRVGLKRIDREGDEVELERQYIEFMHHYWRQLHKHSFLFDGAMEAVSELKHRGYCVGICTNKPEAMAEELLRQMDVRHEFASLIGADTLPVRKPHPTPVIEAAKRAGGDPARSVLIGDTTTDREAARAAGIPSILVTFSPHGRSVEALQPDALLEKFSDLPDLVQSLIG